MSSPRIPLHERAHGRWRTILPQVGIAARHLTGKHGACPICQGGKDRFRFSDLQGAGSWFCNQCGHGTGTDLVMKALGIDFREAARRIEAVIGSTTVETPRPEPSATELRRRMAALWDAGRPVTPRDFAGRYLASRGIALDPFPQYLRTCDTPQFRGMLAKVIGPDGRAVNVHRTYLTAEGRKAEVEQPRKLMRGTFPLGSAVRLAPVAKTLGVAEGIETALSASILFGLPVWAALTEGSMQAFRPPPEVKTLVVFGDHDANFVGQSAAYALAKEAHRLKICAKVHIPQSEGDDWNDELMASTKPMEVA